MRKIINSLIIVTLLLSFVSCYSRPVEPSKNLTGKGIYIWQLWNLPIVSEADIPIKLSWDNDKGESEEHDVMSFESLKKLLVESGVSWIAVKLGDSDSFWLRDGALISRWLGSQGMTFENFLDELHSHGIKVFGWSFVYGSPEWNSGKTEFWCAEKIINSGVDGFIINAEIHLEFIPNPVSYVHEYFEKIESYAPDIFLAHTSFAEVVKHLRFPYSTFARYCDVFMPQNYWVDRDGSCDEFIKPSTEVETFLGELKLLEKIGIRFTKSGIINNSISYEHINLIGSVESNICKVDDGKRGKHIKPEEINEFWKSSSKYFPSGFSLWSADWMNIDDWETLSEINIR